MAACRRFYCDNEAGSNGLCRPCHAEHMRRHRRRYWELTPEQKRRANARSYANCYQRRGLLVPQPCETCGDPDSQKHHDDYDRPLAVRWLCRYHHEQFHRTGETHGQGQAHRR